MSLTLRWLSIFRSLYWKIFFFFWLTLIAAIFSVATLSEIIVQERDQDQYQKVVKLGIKAADIFETKGSAELTQWLHYIRLEFDVTGFMLDAKRRPISLAHLPKNWLEFTLPLTNVDIPSFSDTTLIPKSVSSCMVLSMSIVFLPNLSIL